MGAAEADGSHGAAGAGHGGAGPKGLQGSREGSCGTETLDPCVGPIPEQIPVGTVAEKAARSGEDVG